jgi:hypothetical protein
MEHEGLSPCSQERVIGPYPEPDESNPHTDTIFKISFHIILPYMPMNCKCFIFFCQLYPFKFKINHIA